MQQNSHNHCLHYEQTTCRLQGEIIFSSVSQIYQQELESFVEWLKQQQTNELLLDLQSVSKHDSAGLALIMELYCQSEKQQKSLKIIRMPEQLLHLAQLSEVDQLLNIEKE